MYEKEVYKVAFDIQQRFRVLTITKSRDRASDIATLASGQKLSRSNCKTLDVPRAHRNMFCFTTEETYAEHTQNILAAVWRKANDLEALRDIIPQPLPRK